MVGSLEGLEFVVRIFVVIVFGFVGVVFIFYKILGFNIDGDFPQTTYSGFE